MNSTSYARNLRKLVLPMMFSSIAFILVTSSFFTGVSAQMPQVADPLDDVVIYSPSEENPTSCKTTTQYPDLDIILFSWGEVSAGFSFNITFQSNVSLEDLHLIFYVDVNATYTSASTVPYDVASTFAYSFFIQVTETLSRFYFNISSQQTVTPIVHNGNVVEMIFPSSNEGWLTGIENYQPIDLWNIVGVSDRTISSGVVVDVFNWDLMEVYLAAGCNTVGDVSMVVMMMMFTSMAVVVVFVKIKRKSTVVD
ncbi:MAG: hypothetical protein ACTSUE_06245 [Promethearchaeota archaeon]